MEQQRKCLNACAQKLSLGLVWRELQVFSKLVYRGRNQHRRDKCYQRLTRVSKELRVYQEVTLASHVKKLVKMFLSSDSITQSIIMQGAMLASKLIESAKFIIRLLEFIMETFREVEQRLQMSLFIPFNLLMASSLSRIWYCLRYHLLEIAETYSAIKEGLLSLSKEFFPCLDAYLSKQQSRTYFSIHNSQKLRRIDDLGTTVKRTRQASPVAPEEDKLETIRAGLSEVVTVVDLPNQTKALVQPMDVDGEGLNETANSNDKDLSPVRTKGADEAKNRGIRHKTQRRKQANVLIFRFKSGQKPVKILLRGKKLLAVLSTRNISVAGAKFNCVRLLPTGSLVASRFTLSLVRLQSRTDRQRHNVIRPTMHGDVPNHSQWLEMERTRLSQRNTTPSACVHQLQQKLTQELDSAAAMDVDKESDLKLKHSQSDLLSDKQNNIEQDVDRTSISDEIDDIFGALDDQK